MLNYEHFVAGISGGVASTLVLHPLDLLKIRFAVNDGQTAGRPQYNGLGNSISVIYKQEGLRGFYRGVVPNCWGAGASWGFYFLFYNSIKSRFSQDNAGKALGPNDHILAACEAGALTLVMTNPIWVVKTQLCLQYNVPNSSLSAAKTYTGMLDALGNIYRTEGIPGLYRGFVPGLFGVSHGALQFMAYEELKKYYHHRNHLEPNDKLSTFAYLTCAAASKLFAVVSTYPYQVIRARLQDQHAHYNGVLDVITRTWKYEKIKGFYKGIVPNILRVTPACCLTFIVYENVSHFLLDLSITSS